MQADIAKLRKQLERADFLAGAEGLGKFVSVERDELRELLAIAEAVEAAPVGVVKETGGSLCVVGELLRPPSTACPVSLGQRVKLVPLPDREA